ncbi:MAG TPA: hypothetical protein VN521_05350 [Negativicutes bacterium]|nr:hypothetical protein [Negativicutes bacterium]
MINADQLAVAMLVIEEEEVFVVGCRSDIQRLSEAGHVERAWDFKLDNGHRPYASPKKRMEYDITEEGDAAGNAVTRRVAAYTGLCLAHDLHLVTDTYLFRPTPAFWADLWVDFAAGPGLPPDRKLEDYYAVYRGCILANVSNIKFVRL